MSDFTFHQPCSSCPFLVEHRGKPHANGWYTIANLRRLWNGLRTGKAPGMVCHSTDPKNTEYGGSKAVTPGHERECVGANILIQRELKALEKSSSFKSYREAHPQGLTKGGAIQWVERIMFQTPPLGRPFLAGDASDDRIQPPPSK